MLICISSAKADTSLFKESSELSVFDIGYGSFSVLWHKEKKVFLGNMM
jgi:hypothetical protein